MHASPALLRPFSTALFSWAKTRSWLFSSGGYLDPCGGSSLFDELGCFLRVRHVGHMAGVHFDGLGIGALSHHALLVRIDRPVCGGHHVPSGLGLPGGRRDLMRERVGRDRHLRYSHELRLFLRNVRCEVGREMLRIYPPIAVAVRLERFGGLRRALSDRRTAPPFVERKGGDEDKCQTFWMFAALGDDGPAITVA